MTITGINFGPSQSAINGGANPATVRASYGGLDATKYNATDCVISNPNIEIQCKPDAGSGTGLRWKITIIRDGVESPSPASTAVTAYNAPTISALSGTQNMNTGGGAPITVTGTGLGAPGDTITIEYTGYCAPLDTTCNPGDTFTATSCSVSQPDTEISCSSASGVGGSVLLLSCWCLFSSLLPSLPLSLSVPSFLPPFPPSFLDPRSSLFNSCLLYCSSPDFKLQANSRGAPSLARRRALGRPGLRLETLLLRMPCQ